MSDPGAGYGLPSEVMLPAYQAGPSYGAPTSSYGPSAPSYAAPSYGPPTAPAPAFAAAGAQAGGEYIPGNRTLYIGGIDAEVTYKDLIDRIKGTTTYL